MTIKEAAQEWVRGFNAIPVEVIMKLADFIEITPFTIGDKVRTFDSALLPGEGEIVGTAVDDGLDDCFIVDFGEDGTCTVSPNDMEHRYQDQLPTLRVMWAFGEKIDLEWIERDGLEAMTECGFRIYKQPDFGYIFGFDDEGVDYCTEHWIPLYKARGLHCHDEIEIEPGFGIYRVKITETLAMTVEVEADGLSEAEQQVNDNWNNDEYLIDSEYFTGVTFRVVGKRINTLSRD